jgi:hypothetical protein
MAARQARRTKSSDFVIFLTLASENNTGDIALFT